MLLVLQGFGGVDGVPDHPYPAKIQSLSIGAPAGRLASYQGIIDQAMKLGSPQRRVRRQ
jgi:hypothetical protein